MKLTAAQIGRLALHVESALRKFPPPLPPHPNDEPIADDFNFDDGPSPWEAELKQLVDRDDTLPNYTQISNADDMLDELVDYLS